MGASLCGGMSKGVLIPDGQSLLFERKGKRSEISWKASVGSVGGRTKKVVHTSVALLVTNYLFYFLK